MAEKNGVSAAVGADQNPVDELLGMDKPGDVIDAEFEVTPSVDELQAEIARLTEQISLREKLELQIKEESTLVDRAASEVLSCESAVEEAKGELKAAKERYDKRVNALRDLVRDMAVGQGRLDFAGNAGEMVPAVIGGDLESNLPPAVDPATEAPVSELGKKKLKEIVGDEVFEAAKNSEEPIGLSPGQVETVEGEGCLTIADLEKKLRDYPLFLTDLKGFGAAAQNKLTASLLAWRKVHPQPVVE